MWRNADAFLKVCAGISLISIGTGVGFYYGIHLPRFVEHREMSRKSEADERRARYKSCLASAEDQYFSHWNAECNLIKKEEECALPVYVYSRIERTRDQSLKICIDKFKAGV